MSLFYLSIEFSASFIEYYLMFCLFEFFYTEKHEKNKILALKIIMSGIMAAIVLCINFGTSFSYFAFAIILIIGIAFSKIIYSASFIERLMVLLIYFLAVSILDFYCVAVISLIRNDGNYIETIATLNDFQRITFVIIVKAVSISGFVFLRMALKKKIGIRRKYCRPVILICVLLFIVQIFSYEALLSNSEEKLKIAISVMWLVMLFIVFFVVYIFKLFSDEARNRETYSLISMKNEMLTENFNELINQYRQNSENFHNFISHLLIIKKYADEGCLEIVKKYVEGLLDEPSSSSCEIQTGQDIVDVILNNKIDVARALDIEIDYRIDLPMITKDQAHDICIVLANLLDNALEASAKITDSKGARKICVIIEPISQSLSIRIENAVISDPLITNEHLKTTKSTGNLHGWGLKSVQSIADKNGGTVQHSCENLVFSTVVTLCLLYTES